MNAELTAAEREKLRCLAGEMIPPSDEYGVPGADDPIIFADILRSLGRDIDAVRSALAGNGAADVTLGRMILQSYYRDDRVIRSLGLEPRAPFPKGHTLEQGDWSLLDPVRGRPKMWRDAQ